MRLTPRSELVLKRSLVPIKRCGKDCGYFCSAGPNCNQTDEGKGFIPIPSDMKENFPDFCKLPEVYNQLEIS